MIFGTGSYRYRVVEGWGQSSRPFGGLLTGVTVDSRDRVIISRRKPPALLVYSRAGEYVDTWGEGIFRNPHSVYVDRNDCVWATDTEDHTVRQFSPAGELLRTLGTPGQPGAPGMPFNMPTKVAIGADGDIFVTDGYGQSRVHRFSADGSLLRSWGAPGTGPGQFNLPHSVSIDAYGRLLVADRENCRIQLFDGEGIYLGQWAQAAWPGIQWPMETYIDRDGLVYLVEAAYRISIWRHSLTPVFSPVRTPAGEWELLARWGDMGQEPGQFAGCPHAICADSAGDIYVTEVPFIEDRLQKFERIA